MVFMVGYCSIIFIVIGIRAKLDIRPVWRHRTSHTPGIKDSQLVYMHLHYASVGSRTIRQAWRYLS